MNEPRVQPGTEQADEKYYIVIQAAGPYLVYGKPPLKQQFIMPNEERTSWYMAEGETFETKEPCSALCRCGESKNHPYCDGSHTEADWDPTLTASREPILSGAEVYEGPSLLLSDNQSYCVFARFCDAKGRVWNLVGDSDQPAAKDLTVYEANMCPAGRLTAWEKNNRHPHEPQYDPSIVLIEDPEIHSSGGLFVRGGIPVRTEDGFTYEIRNRATLCRCGQSSSKPRCDGTHASFHWDDGLNKRHGDRSKDYPELETEKVL